MLHNAIEIVGSSEVRPLETLAVYEDFDHPAAPPRYAETLYKTASADYFLRIGRNLFELSQKAAFSWLDRRGFNDVVIHLYCALEGLEIERGTEKDYVA